MQIDYPRIMIKMISSMPVSCTLSPKPKTRYSITTQSKTMKYVLVFVENLQLVNDLPLRFQIIFWIQIQYLIRRKLHILKMNEQPILGMEPTKRIKLEQSQLTQLKNYSTIVADTSEYNLIEKYKPSDSTTNPTLILQLSQKQQFNNIVNKSIQFSIKNFYSYLTKTKKKTTKIQPVIWNQLQQDTKSLFIDFIFDHLTVSIGCQILKTIAGCVSTEVDAGVSFDVGQSVSRAKRIIQLYKDQGIDPSRVLVKLATTWEGIKAAQALKKDKIKCNMTLVFHKIQAVACARSKLHLISPFVGRILDWNKKATGKLYENPAEDPGVISVTQIYNYFKKYQYDTVVMGASFRNTGEIKQLAGCDRLTISPTLLEQLNSRFGEVHRKLDAKKAKELQIEQLQINQSIFRYEMNKNKMATDLLADGIRRFDEDGKKLKELIKKHVEEYIKKEQNTNDKDQKKQ